jgi:glycosyltransferase involved in cell wall biosynthesis
MWHEPELTSCDSTRIQMPNANRPIVSVLMSVYNSEKYLALAINSMLRQSHRDFEFVIVNDGSTDKSSEILQCYATRDRRIRVISRKNGGIVAALNEGLACARGEFIARMDSDDISVPQRLELQLAFMREHPECLAVSCQNLAIDPEGWPIRVVRCPLTHEEIETLHLSGEGGGLCHAAALIRRDALEALGGYRGEFELAEDYDLWLRMGEIGRLANRPEILFWFREHATSLSKSRREQQRLATWKAAEDAYQRRKIKFERPPPPPLNPAAMDYQMRWARYALWAEYYRTARKHAWGRFIRAPATEPLRILAEASVRPVAEPWLWIYDLLRGRKPRNRTRPDDLSPSEKLVRRITSDLARPAG